ncbi:MAG: hypothetical protein DYH13_06660 [Alphaproteobacteria bacterium PRO2]|nr:hypothetical protein [Alphaproteobacteria bacterium PRO2]
MKNLGKFTFGVKRLFGFASKQEISAQDAADLQELSENFLKALSRKGYRGPSATIENINEIYIHPVHPKVLTIETNLRNPGGIWIPVTIDFMESAWGSTRLKRAVELLGFNLVSTVKSPILVGLNPRNFSVTKTGRQSGPKQDIYAASWHPDFSMEVVMVDAPHKWCAKEALKVGRDAPAASEAVIEAPQSARMELTQ